MQQKPNSRLVSLDVFRGIIIAGMILVTDPGTYSAIYPQLRHAEWMGATATDMIFPALLFMVGFSIVLSIKSRFSQHTPNSKIVSHIFYRTIILIILGLAINGFPFYDWHSLRLPGILQRIALCYLPCGLFYLYIISPTAKHKNSFPKLLIPIIILLVGYWLMLFLIPVPGVGAYHLDSFGNLPAYVDRSIFGINHLWLYGTTPGMGITYDPEGLLSTIPAIASTLIGVLTAEYWLHTADSQSKKTIKASIIGVILIIVALVLDKYFPINKRIWTSTFVLLSSGVSLLVFTFVYIIVDIKKWRKWSYLFLVLGSNALLAFILSNVIIALFDLIKIHSPFSPTELSLHKWGNQLSLSTGLSPVNASLLYAIVLVLLNTLIILPLYKRNILVRA
jgi:predicted acyltransferase